MFVNILVSWVTIAGGLWVADKLLNGMEIKGGVTSYLVVAALFGTLNWLLGWLVFGVIGIATLGLGFLLAFVTRVIVSAVMLKLADALSDRFRLASFKVALFAALIMALFNSGVDLLVRTVS